MKIESLRLEKATEALTVMDCYTGRGLETGGHSAFPDIDVDFASDRRHEIKEYLEERYNTAGSERVFSAGTFTTLKLKAALKDVSRVHHIPHSTVNYVTSMLDDDMDWTDLFKVAATNRKVWSFVQSYPEVIEDVRGILGQPKASSIHASAIIVTPSERNSLRADCYDFLPIRKMDNQLVSEFDGTHIERIGLLKEDVLATKELSKLGAVIELVNSIYDAELSIENISKDKLEDEKTYRILAKGFTQNVFQFSSRGITHFIQDVAPTCIEDLIAINALYRPATLEIGATDDFVRYRRGEVAPVYNYGCFEATQKTYGIMIYQEQFMSIAHSLGGFDLGKTDILRKAIGKKDAELMSSLKGDFISGAVGKGCPTYEAEEVWHKIELAGKYSFNRSHAAAYALTAFCGAWLKANYPSAFYTIALEWADDKEIPFLMSEMELCSTAHIVPPDINHSGISFFTNYESDEIYWSLNRIKMVGVKTANYIVDERVRGGNYSSLENFIHRIYRYKLKRYEYWNNTEQSEEAIGVPVNARHVKYMILAGCFDQVEGLKAVTERYCFLVRAAHEMGFALEEKDFPEDLRSKHFFWSQQQVVVSGIGSIDYVRIFNNSEARRQVKGKVAYMPLRGALLSDHEGRRIAVCATVTEITENSYTDKASGKMKRYGKLILQQNNDIMECVCWNDFYLSHRAEILQLKNKIVIFSAVVRYSDFKGANGLQTYKSSILYTV